MGSRWSLSRWLKLRWDGFIERFWLILFHVFVWKCSFQFLLNSLSTIRCNKTNHLEVDPRCVQDISMRRSNNNIREEWQPSWYFLPFLILINISSDYSLMEKVVITFLIWLFLRPDLIVAILTVNHFQLDLKIFTGSKRFYS